MTEPLALQQHLSALEAELEVLKSSGDYFIGVRVERATAGGSASKAAKETWVVLNK